jgi:hypothetical protein
MSVVGLRFSVFGKTVAPGAVLGSRLLVTLCWSPSAGHPLLATVSCWLMADD